MQIYPRLLQLFCGVAVYKVAPIAAQTGVGTKQILWDGRDDLGEAMATGVYFHRLVAGTVSKTRCLLLK